MQTSITVKVPSSFFSSVRDRIRDVQSVREAGWLVWLKVGADGLRDLRTIAEHEQRDDPVAAEAAALLELVRA